MHSLGKRADLHGSREFESPPLRIATKVEQSGTKARLPKRRGKLAERSAALVPMANILLQTTIADAHGEWNARRFAFLAGILRSVGHQVTARNREPLSTGDDAVLPSLAESPFQQLWLIAADSGSALSPNDVRGILRFRERGGAMLTARDRENIGASLLNLGALGSVNNFQSFNPEPQAVSGVLLAEPCDPATELLRTVVRPGATLSIPDKMPFARVIATSPPESGALNLAVAIENEPAGNGTVCGRALALSTFYLLADTNWPDTRRSSDEYGLFTSFIAGCASWLSAG